MVQNCRLEQEKEEPVKKERYQNLLGKLIYLSHTWPEIAYAISMVSQFMHLPQECQLEVVQRILRYLKSTPSHSLMFCNNDHLKVKVHIDAY